MNASRLLPAFVFVSLAAAVLLVVPTYAQTKPPSLTARIEALEKDNAALREDVNRLQTLLIQTRRDMIVMEGGAIRGGGGGYVATMPSLVQPQSLGSQQAQTQAQINQMNTQTQLNNLQLQQSMAQDRLREQQVLPPPFGTATP